MTTDQPSPLFDAPSVGCLSELTLDRLRLGELTDEVAQAHLASCEACSLRLSEMREAHEAFQRDQEVPLIAARLRGRARKSAAVRVARWVVPLAAAIMVVVAIPREATVREKGGGGLRVLVRHPDGGVDTLGEHATLRAAEQIRFMVDLNATAYVGVLGFDSHGKADIYFPPTGELPELTKGEQLLDVAVELDQALGPERWVALMCQTAPARESLRALAEAALRAAGGQPARLSSIGTGCREISVLTEKVE